MKKINSFLLSAAVLAAVTTPALAQFEGYVNKGLVGVGRASGDALDATGLDSLGGLGSSMVFDPATWTRTGDEPDGYTYSGTLYAAPDCGYGSGVYDYHPRIQSLHLSVTPYYGSVPTNQTQIWFTNFASTYFTYDGTNFTGADPNDFSGTPYPLTTTASVGQGHRSFDPEGVVQMPDGGFILADEYGPFLFRFNSSGALQSILQPPPGYIPKLGTYPNTTNYYTAAKNPQTGRIRNRGFEGLSITPDGKRLFSILQDPIVQDGGLSKASQNNRILVWDIESGSPMEGQPVAEYVYRLTLNGSATANNLQTGTSELLALNREQLLVTERDSNGVGADAPTPVHYKRVVLVSLRGATNILNTGYDLDLKAPGQLSLPTNASPAGIEPVQRQDFVDLIDPNQLAKFGLNISTNWDTNTLSEKWESLALVPLDDPAAPNDYLLLVCNDNDFLAHVVTLNGQLVATNSMFSDNVMMAFRVTLPTYGAAAPSNEWPGLTFTGPTNATLSAPARVNLTVNAYDQDGIVTKVEFYEDATKLGEDATFPFALTLNDVAAGTHTYTAVCTDNEGTTGMAAKVLEVTTDNLPPNVTLSGPTNATLWSPAKVALMAAADDPDGDVTKVEFFDDASKMGEKTTAPYSLTLSGVVAGTHTYTVVATDNQGATTTSAPVVVEVVPDTTPPAIICPNDIVVNCASTNGTPVTFTVTATDNNAQANVTLVCVPPSGSLFFPGTNAVVCTATDAADNMNTCAFNVIVLPSAMSIERAVILRWNCSEMLQGADNPEGPWTDIPEATSPWAVPTSEAKRFYRVRSGD